MLKNLDDENLDTVLIKRALSLLSNIQSGNVVFVFHFFSETKDHSKFIIEIFNARWKIWGLKLLSKIFGISQDFNYEFACSVLGYDNISDL